MRVLACSILVVVAFTGTLRAQSPTPVVVSAASPMVASTPGPAAPGNSGSIQATLKMLQEMRTANEETLRKQTATLAQLDELEKASEQIKIYTKRN